jgi:formylglycine-generating enzyme required for sulfatase activity
MSAPRLGLNLVVLLLIACSAASAVTMSWSPVGDPGNPCDTQPSQGCFGSVGYSYNIGTYEVTNAQYTEFLNAKAQSDPFNLYNTAMAQPQGGITRTGSDGSFSYSTIAGRENNPVNFVSFYDAIRFANWMNNGQGGGDTESGSYTLLGFGPQPSNGGTVPRNAGATIAVTNENEWYKAAYYDAVTTSYFDYPMRTDAPSNCTAPTSWGNSAWCNQPGWSPPVQTGSYPSSASPYGTFDQGGNLWEWNETIGVDNTYGTYLRQLRGGGFNADAEALAASFTGYQAAVGWDSNIGFRLVMVPEPGTGLLVIAGLLCFAGWRRVRA